MTVLDYLTRCGGQLAPTTGVITGLPTATGLGLTVRDYFAGQALAGLLTRHEPGMDLLDAGGDTNRALAALAYEFADDLLAERQALLDVHGPAGV